MMISLVVILHHYRLLMHATSLFLLGQFLAKWPNLSHLKHWMLKNFLFGFWFKVAVGLLSNFLLFPCFAWATRAWVPSSRGSSNLFLDNFLDSSWTQSAHRSSNLGNYARPQILWINGSHESRNPLRIIEVSFESATSSPIAFSWSLNWENFMKKVAIVSALHVDF